VAGRWFSLYPLVFSTNNLNIVENCAKHRYLKPNIFQTTESVIKPIIPSVTNSPLRKRYRTGVYYKYDKGYELDVLIDHFYFIYIVSAEKLECIFILQCKNNVKQIIFEGNFIFLSFFLGQTSPLSCSIDYILLSVHL
jgi:hypothetical protein